jgi:hypothetical protein
MDQTAAHNFIWSKPSQLGEKEAPYGDQMSRTRGRCHHTDLVGDHAEGDERGLSGD